MLHQRAHDDIVERLEAPGVGIEFEVVFDALRILAGAQPAVDEASVA